MALSVSQLAAITHNLIVPKLVDNLFNSNPLFLRFRKRGVKYDSGRTIRIPIVYQDLSTTQAYRGAEVLSTDFQDNLTAADYDWKQYTTLYGVTGYEEIQNGGKEGVLNLLEAKRRIAELSLSNTLGTDMWVDGGTKALDGFDSSLVATGAHGGINQSDFSNWAAYVHSLGTAGTLSLFEMQKIQGGATVGGDGPTVWVTRQSVYDKIWSLIQPDQRFTDSEMAKAGFGGIMFNGLPIVVDSHVVGSDGDTQDNWLAALNENYVGLAIHSGVNFKVVPIPTQKDQDVKMTRILFAGNLWLSNRRTQGVVKTVDPNL